MAKARVQRKTVSSATHPRPQKPAPNGGSRPAGASGNGQVPAGLHTEAEDDPWRIFIPDHPARHDSPEYVAARKKMNDITATVDNFYGPPKWQDHHGGGLWLKDEQGWFLVRNWAGMEWSSQFCADPKKVDKFRQNARRLYARFPEAVDELGIRGLLDTEITDAQGIANWTDSICNASVPLPPALHTGVLPQGGGVHHYPSPVAEIALFKHDDFKLWVVDPEGQPAAVTPTSPRGSGDGRVQVVYATPGTALGKQHVQAEHQGEQLILNEQHPMALQAYRRQYSNAVAKPKPVKKVTADALPARPAPVPTV